MGPFTFSNYSMPHPLFSLILKERDEPGNRSHLIYSVPVAIELQYLSLRYKYLSLSISYSYRKEITLAVLSRVEIASVSNLDFAL